MSDEKRTHLGASSWSSCSLKMWFIFRNAKQRVFNKEKLRTFALGHFIEGLVIDELARDGHKVGSNQAPVVYKGLKFGHIDGVIDGDLLEVKSAKEARFKAMKKKLPDNYYAQVQIYMKLLIKKLCQYYILNKNTSELYHTTIALDDKYATEQVERMYSVITNYSPPMKNTSYECAWCDYKDICEGRELAEISCGTCVNVDTDSGRLKCKIGDSVCNQHLYHPLIVELVDGYYLKDVDAENKILDFGLIKLGGGFLSSSEFFDVVNKTQEVG